LALIHLVCGGALGGRRWSTVIDVAIECGERVVARCSVLLFDEIDLTISSTIGTLNDRVVLFEGYRLYPHHRIHMADRHTELCSYWEYGTRGVEANAQSQCFGVAASSSTPTHTS